MTPAVYRNARYELKIALLEARLAQVEEDMRGIAQALAGVSHVQLMHGHILQRMNDPTVDPPAVRADRPFGKAA